MRNWGNWSSSFRISLSSVCLCQAGAIPESCSVGVILTCAASIVPSFKFKLSKIESINFTLVSENLFMSGAHPFASVFLVSAFTKPEQSLRAAQLGLSLQARLVPSLKFKLSKRESINLAINTVFETEDKFRYVIQIRSILT